MDSPNNQWPSTEKGNHTLFFAQSVREQMTLYSWDNFRVPTHDTLSRLKEVITVCDQVLRGSVRSAAVDSALEELKWSLRRDVVVRNSIGEAVEQLIKRLDRSSFSISTISKTSSYIENLLERTFKESIEQELIDTVEKAVSKSDISRLSQAYCSHLLHIGFSRTYIFQTCRSIFFADDIRLSGKRLLKKFFSKFNTSLRKKFVVYYRIGEKSSKIIGVYPFKIHSNLKKIDPALTARHKQFFRTRGRQIIIEHRTTALDHVKAKEDGERIIDFYFGMTKMTPHTFHLNKFN